MKKNKQFKLKINLKQEIWT